MRHSSHFRFDENGDAWMRGHVGIQVDDADWDRVRAWLWYPIRQGARVYMVCNNPRQDSLHRFIMHAQPGEIVHHVNDNGLDNRRDNLRIVTASEHKLAHHDSTVDAAQETWRRRRERGLPSDRHET